MTILDKIQNILTEVAPEGTTIELEDDYFNNLKVDAENRENLYIQIVEPESGRYLFDRGTHARKTAILSIYFFRYIHFRSNASKGNGGYSTKVEQKTVKSESAPGGYNTKHTETEEISIPYRQEIRDEIEQSAVIPFIRYVKETAVMRRYFPGAGVRVNWVYPLYPKFDANEVGILLRIEITEILC